MSCSGTIRTAHAGSAVSARRRRPRPRARMRRVGAVKAATAGARPDERLKWRPELRSSSSCPRESGPFSRRHPAAAGRSQPRRRHRLGVRRPRLVRTLPGAGRRWGVREARGNFVERQPVAVQRAGNALLAARSRVGRGPAPLLFGARRSRCGDRRAGQQPGASPGGAQGSRCTRAGAESGGSPALRAGEGTGHARPLRRPAPAVRGAGIRVGPEGSGLRSIGAANAAAGPACRRVAGHRGGARRKTSHRDLAGVA